MVDSGPMLKFLNIGNLAVTDRLRIEFQNGLNLLTGETGSGKSIIVDALSLLFGERLTGDKIRSGEQHAWVEGIFQLDERLELRERLDRLGFPVNGDELVLKREWTAGGRGRSFVNESLAGAAALKELRSALLEIHGQGDEHALLSASSHLDLLDQFGGQQQQRNDTARWAERHAEGSAELAELKSQEAARLRSIDVLRFQVSEIDRVEVRIGEDEELTAERRLLSQAEKAARLAAECYATLYDDEEAICSRLTSITRKLTALSEIDPEFSSGVEQADRAIVGLQDIAIQLRDFGAGKDFTPERLAQVDGRLAELDRLKRKYGPDLSSILAERDRMAEELGRLESADSRVATISQELREVESRYESAAAALSVSRKKVAPGLEAAVRRELNQLAMRGARFEVCLTPSGQRVSSRGLEEAEFMVALNVGEGLHPLARVASGGELSRIMLALRTDIADGVSKCLVFDEIDAGIGGRAAEEVGGRLKRLAKSHQVLCVTHQPQIARFADAHYRVSKGVREGRTRVEVELLDDQGRLEELSRMLAGTEVTAVARRHARELIRTA